MEQYIKQIQENIAALEAELKSLLDTLGRKREEISLVAVSKTHPVEYIEAAIRCGIGNFGENKVQEALRKVPMIREPYEGFHFIGHLQTNKINQLLSLKPKLIHSIGSLYLAERLNRACGNRNLIQDVLVQVNVSGEEQKSGVSFSNALDSIIKIASYPNLRVKGLMTIGRLHPDREHNRPYYKELKALFDQINAMQLEGLSLLHLSMGMSGDWQPAIQEGSNMIRIGSSIFGERDYGDIR
ncbi:MAG: YggS family pyridoxal phosphate-dependent enzyme [Candidatus Cloacimonetes bacterium]|nr:YggS family pyridoxal phosphate-dependent enzyme [Candidatus Cloacimonadota bacterium]